MRWLLIKCVHFWLAHILIIPGLGAYLEPYRGYDANALRLKRQETPANDTLECFQVYPPVLTPRESSDGSDENCVTTMTLMEHDFAFSYGMPFVGQYTPPSCSFNRVTMNFTVTSQGRQFDRLAIMYLGDTEVWRTSTAEPTTYGIVFTYIKEMQHFNALWKDPQKIIFDLGNLVDDTYTGIWHTTLTATFFTVPDSLATADSILPISSRNSASSEPSVFQIPRDDASVAYTLPMNIDRAVVSLSGCGQASEEFWYSNVLSSVTETFADTTGSLYGGSPWREMQLLIDGQLAGVVWPFPIIFTGGIVPGLWRPIVGINAFDLRESEIDITPWLPYLLDGASHTFSIRVASLDDDGAGTPTLLDTPGDNWLVTGKIFLFLSSSDTQTTGTKPQIYAPPPQFSLDFSTTQASDGTNETLTYSVTATRQLSISATVNGHSVSWNQDLDYTNYNKFTAFGVTQVTNQTTSGSDAAQGSGYARSFTYPIYTNSTYSVTSNLTLLSGALDRGESFRIVGPAVFPQGVQSFHNANNNLYFAPQEAPLSEDGASLPNFAGSTLATRQTGDAWYTSRGPGGGSFSSGTTAQTMRFAGVQSSDGSADVELYTRDVKAVNTTIVRDEERLLGRQFGEQTTAMVVGEVEGPSMEVALESVRDTLGRGPGT